MNERHVVTRNSYTPGVTNVANRISKTILSKQAVFGTSSAPSPQCIRGSLMKTVSSPCPLHGNATSLCASEAKVLCKANKILQYVIAFHI